MADVFDQGGGGGRAGVDLSDLSNLLSKPYDLQGLNQTTIDQINQMFEELYRALRQTTQVNTQRLLGRFGAQAGSQQEITIGDGLSLSALGVLSGTGADESSGTTTTGVGNVSMRVAVRNITDAELKALNGTPLVIIPAPGANQFAAPLIASFSQQITVGFSTNQNGQLRYKQAVQNVGTAFNVSLTSAPAHRMSHSTPSYPSGSIDLRANDVELLTGGTAGPAGTTADGSRLVVTYLLFDVL